MNKAKAEEMVIRLLGNAAGLKYGTAALSVKIHDGRVVQVMYSTTENTLDTRLKDEDGEAF